MSAELRRRRRLRQRRHLCLQRGGVGAAHLLHLRPALVKLERRHGTDAALRRDLVLGVDVHLHEDHVGIVRGHLLEEGRDPLARTAPGRRRGRGGDV